MKPLIDADILLHEIGWSGEFKDKETGLPLLFSYERVGENLRDKIAEICMDLKTEEKPLLFITDSPFLVRNTNRWRRLRGEDERGFVRNFRYEVAKSKPYKGTRKNPKPYHFENMLVDFLINWDTIVSSEGLEADDEMSIYQMSAPEDTTVICSRDKDLRITPGWHYSWECGKQKAVPLTKTDRVGWLTKVNGKTLGYGMSFFYYQMLVGDNADNIPGLPRVGDKIAFNLLSELKTEEKLLEVVKSLYKEKGFGKDYFIEQANLLFIRQERNKGYEF